MGGKEKRYFWLKLRENFFSQKEIKRLRKIAGGDTYTIIYLKMLLRSLKTNGVLYFDGIEDDFVSELALDIDEEQDNVEVTVNYLMKKGILVEQSEEEYLLTSCLDMIGGEAASSARSRKCREQKQRRQQNVKMLQCNGNELQCNTSATNCNTEIEIDKEKIKSREDIEKIRVRDREESDDLIDRLDKSDTLIAVLQLFEEFYPTYPKHPTLAELTPKTKQEIFKSREQYSLADFQTVFEKAEHSSFLKGENENKWKAVFGWLVKAENMEKVLSGMYDNDKWSVLKRITDRANREWEEVKNHQAQTETN